MVYDQCCTGAFMNLGGWFLNGVFGWILSRCFQDVCSKGSFIAERVADQLNYECISREILMEASDQFNIPEIKLAKAIHDGPSVFEKFFHGKPKYIAFFQAALLNHLKKDNIIYHGLGGQFFLQGIPNVLKTRIIMDMDARISEESKKENVPEIVAKKILLNDLKDRHRWGLHVYGLDTADNELYDIILHLGHLTINDCINIICKSVELETFQSTPQSLAMITDLALDATVKAAIVEHYPDIRVKSQEGRVSVHVNNLVPNPEKVEDDIKTILDDIPEIVSIRVNVKSNQIQSLIHH